RDTLSTPPQATKLTPNTGKDSKPVAQRSAHKHPNQHKPSPHARARISLHQRLREAISGWQAEPRRSAAPLSRLGLWRCACRSSPSLRYTDILPLTRTVTASFVRCTVPLKLRPDPRA